jgi:hypothetical protein
MLLSHLTTSFNNENQMGKTRIDPLIHSTQNIRHKWEEHVHNLLDFYYFTSGNVPQS